MTARFDPVDFSKIPVPDAIENWSLEAILSARMSDFVARMTQAGLDYNVSALKSDPSAKLQEADAYREGLIRQRINEAVRATYLAHARQADLDARASEYLTRRADGESDESLRARAQKSWENLSIGGSYGGYAYQALSVAPNDLADVAVYGYEASEAAIYGDKVLDIVKGEVRVALLGAAQNGRVASSLVNRVQSVLAQRDRRKVNDQINVVQASLRPYVVDATLHLKRASAPAAILDAAKERAKAYGRAARLIGLEATRGGFFAALMAAEPGLVVDVDLRAPESSVAGGPCEAPILSGLHIDWRYA